MKIINKSYTNNYTNTPTTTQKNAASLLQVNNQQQCESKMERTQQAQHEQEF